MHQKRNERIAYILCTIGVLLLILFVMLYIFPENVKKTAAEMSQDETASEGAVPVAMSGMEFFIPEGFRCYPDEESSMVIYREDAVVWVGVFEDSYEDVQEKKEELIPQTEEKGYTVISSIEEYQTEQRSYLYYVMDNEERTQYILYAPAGMDSHFGIIADAPGWTREEVLKVVDAVVGPAQETEKEDTSVYDLLLIHPNPVEREFLSEGALECEREGMTVSFQVPEGFYGGEVHADMETDDSYQCFTNYDANIHVTVSLIEDAFGVGAEDYIQSHSLMLASTNLGITQAVINGKTVYYYSNHHTQIYEDSKEQYYNFYAVIDLGNGQFYQVDGFSLSNPDALEAETYEEFLTINTESK